MSSSVDRLEAQGRVEDAAREAERLGLMQRAASLFERACRFDDAARCALAGGDARHAVLMASLGADESVLRQACAALACKPDLARSVGASLAARGDHRASAMLLEAAGDTRSAAAAWVSARQPLRAARAWQAADDVREAARVLDAALRDEPDREDLLAELGSLLARLGKHDAAARMLQRIPSESPLRSSVLPQLAASFAALGLEDPREAVEQEARTLGVSLQAAAAPGKQAPRGVVYGRYEVARVAASTPAARVLEAIDRVTGGRVAIKQLLASGMVGSGRDAFGRLVREARALQQLRHPHVVPLVELIEDAAAIVTPWMPGGSLADLLARGPMAPARAVEIACTVLGALGEAHRLGILHRDLKPSNVLFDDAGVPFLADFGAAHVSDASATATAAVIGTLAYMSPEQRAGLPASASSDVFGVGATLFEMLTMRTPQLQGAIEPLPSHVNPDLGPRHDSILLSLLAEDPAKRPAGALEARNLLRQVPWPAELPRLPMPPPEPTPADRGSGSRLAELGGDRALDQWLNRQIVRVPLDDAVLGIVRAWASVSSDALATVLRADTAHGALWLELPAGGSPSSLSRRELQQLRSDVSRLHERGAAHGAIDLNHLVRTDYGVVLLFDARSALSATPQGDLAAIDLLESTALDG